MTAVMIYTSLIKCNILLNHFWLKHIKWVLGQTVLSIWINTEYKHPEKRAISYFSTQTYVVGTPKNEHPKHMFQQMGKQKL